MKFDLQPGEFAFKALYQSQGKQGWLLSEIYFFSKEEAQQLLGHCGTIKWPVETLDTGGVYIPDESEYK